MTVLKTLSDAEGGGYSIFIPRCVFISEAFAQAAPAATASESPLSSLTSMLPLVLMFVVLYFVMIRPQMKKQKELKKFRESIKVGDKVVTIGGIHGKILELNDTTVLISSEGSKIRLDKSAISTSSEDLLSAVK